MTLFDKCQQAGDREIHDKYVYIAQTGSGVIEIPLTGEQIKSICTQGQNDEAVAVVCASPKVAEAVGKYSYKQIVDALAETGSWSDEELQEATSADNISRLVWMLAWDIAESENPNDSLAIDEMQTISFARCRA